MSTGAILDVLGVLEGTDKSSLGHGYLQYYEEILRPLRQERFTLLEIGVSDGGSLRCWKAYFPNAQIIGVDIDPHCKSFEEERIRVEIGSQDDPEFLDRIVQKDRPLVVIDDGSHMAHHMIATFERVYPALLPDGYYVFEDAYMHYGNAEAAHIGLSRLPLKEYCANLATSKARGWIDPAENYGIAKYVFEHTASVTYLSLAILIRKRRPSDDTGDILQIAQRIAAESGLAQHWLGFANLTLTRNGDAALAETAARKAIEAGARGWRVALCLSQALERQGRIDEAINVAEQAVPADPRAVRLLEWIGHAHSRRGDHVRAGAHFRQAITVDPHQPWFHLYLSKSLMQLGEIEQALESATEAERLARNAPGVELFATHKDHMASLIPRKS